MTDRTYISKQLPELEELVSQASDKTVLRKILTELTHRKKKRARELELVVKAKIDGDLNSSDLQIDKVKTTLNSGENLDQMSLNKINPKPLSINKLIVKPTELMPAIINSKNNSMTKKTEIIHSNKNSVTSYPEGFLTRAFEEMRNKLLDISGGRSRLLNLNQDTKGFVRVVDELPNQLAEHLLASKSFTMNSVNDPTEKELIEHGFLVWDGEEEKYVPCKPMPKAREWAKVKGIRVDYNLPLDSCHAEDDRHQDNNVQTVMFDSALSTAMKKLSNQAKTSIEETGNNILFLSLGFLEWTDKIAGKERLAPLYMIPVKIEKTVFNSVVRYGIKFTGEDIIANLTLHEKLSQDFEVELPSIFDRTDEDKILSPEEYFSNVESLLAMKAGDATMSNWCLRRFATLSTLSLGRLLMYRDLDPARWPKGEDNLVEHDFIRKFFSDDQSNKSSGSTNGGSNTPDSGYILDNVTSIHENFPMVDDADSSQMSALIDILNGESMVVEGPPGTGKSQTITNLISAAISQGKSVLFVAEKQAALDVVKRRMDKAGLGDFCLDLHSDKAQKRMVLDSFNKRIQFRGRHQFKNADYDIQVQRYESSRKQLQDYCLMVNKNWKNTGFTIHEILCAATRYSKDVVPLTYAEISPEGISGENFTRFELDSQLEQLELFFEYLDIVSQQLPEAGSWQSHPWFGVNNKSISGSDAHQLQNQLNDWTTRLEVFNENLNKVFDKHGIENEGLLTLDDLDKWVKELCQIKSLSENEYLPAFKQIDNDQLYYLGDFIQIAHDVSHSFQELGCIFNQDLLSDFKKLSNIKKSIQEIEALGVAKEIQFDDLARSIGQLERAISLAQSIENKRSELLPHLSMAYKSELEGLFSLTRSGFTELALFIDHVMVLPAELLNYRSDIYDEETLPPIFSKFKKIQGSLIDEHEKLSQSFKLDRIPDVAKIKDQAIIMAKSGFFSVFNSVWRKTKQDILAYSLHEKIAKNTIAESLNNLASWKESCNSLQNSMEYKTALGPEFKGIDTNSSRIETLMNWYQSVRKDYGIGFGVRTVIAKTLFSLNKDIFRGIQQLHKDGINNQISEFLNNLNNLANIFKNLECVTDVDSTLSPQAESLKKGLLSISVSLEGIQKYLINPNFEQRELLNALSKLERLGVERDKFERANLSDKFFDGTLNLDLGSKGSLPKDLSVVESTLSYLSSIYDVVTNEEILSLLTQRISETTVTDLVTSSISLQEDKKNALSSEMAVMASIESDREQWGRGSGLGVKALCERNQLAINSIEWLDGWTKYLHAKERMQEGGQGKLKDYFVDSHPTLEYGKQVMNFAVFTCLANEVYKQEPELAIRSGHEQTAIQAQFKKYDDGLKEIQRHRVAHLTLKRTIDKGSSGAKVSSYTGDLLLRHEISKKSRHIAIRKLVERAGDAMLGYKPCFMMSPMAVAKYLPPGRLKFDLVVMDEASQVKPEFALSCFARGKQAIVVGDPKQLPPTNFFERSTSNESMEDDDLGVINDSESILDAIGSHYPKRMLQWHYRSRHESLIDFSNRHFYDGELVIFPSPWAQSDEFGIKFNHVKNGVFVSGINNEEAKHIVEAIKYHVLHNENESLGIVAMNFKQREQIEVLLDAKRSQDLVLDAGLKRDAQTEDPIFIKSLENVQGDERDVIIISFTYGPQNRGGNSVPQRFGPINSEQGWRRLNVLFTRSKKRIQIYSSMRSGQIILSDTSKRGVRALKNYLSYAESGELIDQAGDSQGIPDSDFEIAVMKQLAAAGYECVSQVGVAGFKIDVGVRDPGMPGRYLMGIECDGATYHSSKSTRDRDRVRQGVLEGLGWNIKRVWSTDWFKNPDAELKPIIDYLNRMATPVSELPIQIKAKHENAFDLKSEPFDAEQPQVAEQEIQEELVFDESSSGQNLKSRLEDFNEHIIEKEFPDTPTAKRLLRAEMLDMLDSERPINLDDFSEFIPNYLRTHTSVEEASRFLGDVLEIIAVYEELHN
jgi:superfamily I DNA and/or RNA helicase